MYGITASVMASCGHFLSWLASLGAEPDLFTGLHLAFLSPSSCGGRALSAGAPSRRELRWSRGTCEIHSLLSPILPFLQRHRGHVTLVLCAVHVLIPACIT